jgi:hypothetical protein
MTNLFQINTTAWDEEDFLLITTLTEEQIVKVITPIVMEERELEEEIFKDTINDDTFKQWDKVNKYDNDFLVQQLQDAYPTDVVRHYVPSQIDLISI